MSDLKAQTDSKDPLFKDTQALKDFIVWAKAEKIKRFKVDNVEIEISDYGLIGDLLQSGLSESTTAPLSEVQKTPEQIQKEEEDLLFHSST